MVWWCPSVRPGSPSVHPSVRPSVRPSQFSALFSYMLWDIKLKFCVSPYFDARRRSSSNAINLRQFLLELCLFWTSHTYKYAVFRRFLIHALTYWAENFCKWLCFTLIQIKFECRKFASIFVAVTPLLELTILGKHSFPHFSLTFFDILS